MIAYVLTALILPIIIFCITAKLSVWVRILVVGVFIAITVFLFPFLIQNFDEPADGYRLITREEIDSWSSKK